MGTAAQPKWGWATVGSSFDWADQVETAKLVSGGQADLCGCFILFMRLKCNTVSTAAKLKKETGANRTSAALAGAPWEWIHSICLPSSWS